ncbi:MAG: hypothetical protein JXR89_07940 [Deltaproteobacteria bacterium]|nr:hypothetical protein [Deltaproteobacteria bacterium]
MNAVELVAAPLPELSPEISELDEKRFFKVLSNELTAEDKLRIVTPDKIFKRQEEVLAVHWHPEFIPLELIARRLEALFPDRKQELIIPTQHNVLMEFNGFSGVEVDCYSSGFNRKVQLLIHLQSDRAKEAGVFKNILEHTFKYRSSQFFSFLQALTRPQTDWLEKAASATGTGSELVAFIAVHARKIEKLIDQYYDKIPSASIKNKLLRNYFDELRDELDASQLQRIQTFLRALKEIVKSHFSLKFFYRTSEIIEEARSLGAGIVIPHPEQFWPILLADYDVDGYEIWNPQSREYTEFLISVLERKNQGRRPGRRLLAFMGDDTHFGEKLKIIQADPKVAEREIGVQPAWDDLAISKELIKTGMSKRQVIEEYESRLRG